MDPGGEIGLSPLSFFRVLCLWVQSVSAVFAGKGL